MRTAIVALAMLVIAGVVGLATTTFRPSSDDDPLQPITVEAPAQAPPDLPAPRSLDPAANLPVPPLVVPDVRSQLPPPPPPVPARTNDVPPPPPAVDGDDDFDDWAGDDDGDDDD